MKSLNNGALLSKGNTILEVYEIVEYKYKGKNKIKYKCYERFTNGLIRTSKTFIIKENDLIKYKVLDWTF